MNRYPTSLTLKLEKAGYAFRFESVNGTTRCRLYEVDPAGDRQHTDRNGKCAFWVDGPDEIACLREAIRVIEATPAKVDPRDAKIAALEAKLAAAAAEPEPEPETESEPRPRNRRATKRQADAASNDED